MPDIHPLDEAIIASLVDTARAMRERAYAPYSKFTVGAALLCEDGTIVPGCNVENVSYGLTNCAERVAIGAAIAQGRRAFRAIAVAGPTAHPLTPCGACRQVLAEFGPDLVVICVAPDGSRLTLTTRELLPHAFTQSDLDAAGR